MANFVTQPSSHNAGGRGGGTIWTKLLPSTRWQSARIWVPESQSFPPVQQFLLHNCRQQPIRSLHIRANVCLIHLAVQLH